MSSNNSQPSKIELKSRKIPRDAEGDPAFTQLSYNIDGNGEDNSPTPGDVLEVFAPQEVVTIVNRYIKFQEASALTHKKLAEKNRERLGPIKQKVRQMFNISFTQATDAQVSAAIEQLVKERTQDGT